MRASFLTLLTLFNLALASWASAQSSPPITTPAPKFMFLIPGFFNIPGERTPRCGVRYFSSTILQTVRDQGFTPVEIDTLDPVGTVEQNGARLLHELNKFRLDHPGTKFSAIAHSAGGLYLAWAVTADPSLPLHQVVTIATPYRGVDLINTIGQIPGANVIAKTLNLDGLREFEHSNMRRLLSQMRIPASTRWIAVGATQPRCRLANCSHAERQSWLLSLASSLFSGPGDGVVSVESALGDGDVFQFETLEDLTVPLEHWEVVLDSRLFALLGVSNSKWIDRQQRASFTRILQTFQ